MALISFRAMTKTMMMILMVGHADQGHSVVLPLAGAAQECETLGHNLK